MVTFLCCRTTLCSSLSQMSSLVNIHSLSIVDYLLRRNGWRGKCRYIFIITILNNRIDRCIQSFVHLEWKTRSLTSVIFGRLAGFLAGAFFVGVASGSFFAWKTADDHQVETWASPIDLTRGFFTFSVFSFEAGSAGTSFVLFSDAVSAGFFAGD